MPMLFLIGGARSGKSGLALRLATEQPAPVVFVATGEAGDDEMRTRIEEHRRARRPSWQTIEEPLQLGKTLEAIDGTSCVVVDCLTLWAANALERLGASETEAQAKEAAVIAAARTGTSFGASTPSEIDLADAVIAAYPSMEKLRFVSSGTEATMSAIRLARAFTNRKYIVKF